MFVEDFKHLKFCSNLLHISKCEVYQEELASSKRNIIMNSSETPDSMIGMIEGGERVHWKYHLQITAKKRGFKVESENYPIIDKVYSILSS